MTSAMTSDSLAIIKRGQSALRRLDKDRNWEDWIQVGYAVVECRSVAMREAGANRPFGPAYTKSYASLMEHYRFTEKLKDKSDRSRLVEIMDNLPAVTAWRQGLTPDERRKYTHPTTVFRYWKTAQRKSVEAESPDVWRPSTRHKLKTAEAEIHKLRKEGAATPWGPDDPPYLRARAVMEAFGLSIVESEQLAVELLRLVQERRGDGSDR
jgi:hypothetical protein